MKANRKQELCAEVKVNGVWRAIASRDGLAYVRVIRRYANRTELVGFVTGHKATIAASHAYLDATTVAQQREAVVARIDGEMVNVIPIVCQHQNSTVQQQLAIAREKDASK